MFADRRGDVSEPILDAFELVGDPDALPDAFFDALAGLLLELDAKGSPNQYSSDTCAMDATVS